jgi:hypothetical protein
MLVLHKNGIQNYHGDKKVKHQLYDLSLNSFQRYIFGFLFSIFGCVSSPILNMMLDPFKDRQWQFQIVFLVQKFFCCITLAYRKFSYLLWLCLLDLGGKQIH